jgi:hypothetical protein
MKRVFAVLFWMLLATLVCSAQSQNTFYFPHIANGIIGDSIWKTTIYLANTGTFTTTGTVTFKKDAEGGNTGLPGNPFTDVAILDENNAPAATNGVISFSIPAGQLKKYYSTGLGILTGGNAVVTTTAGSVNGTAIFSRISVVGGFLLGEAGTPASPAVNNQSVFVDTDGFLVGVAYANPGTTAAQVSLSLISNSGATLGTANQTLGPGNHTAAFTAQLFPSVRGPVLGTLQIRSNIPLAATALRFDLFTPAFTSIPPVTLGSLINSGIEWLEKRDALHPFTSVARLLGAFRIA